MPQGLVQEVHVSHDSGFRRKSHVVARSHKQRTHRDHASRVFEDRMREQQKARERSVRAEKPAEDEEESEA